MPVVEWAERFRLRKERPWEMTSRIMDSGRVAGPR